MSRAADFRDQTTGERGPFHAVRKAMFQPHYMGTEGDTNLLGHLTQASRSRALTGEGEMLRYLFPGTPHYNSRFVEYQIEGWSESFCTSHIAPYSLGRGAVNNLVNLSHAVHSRLYNADLAPDLNVEEPFFAAQADIVQDVRSLPSEFEKALKDLERLTAGWAGPGSIVPTEAAIRDITAIGAYLPAEIASPDVDVDPTTGDVTLRWTRPTSRSSFALYFKGNGEVMGTVSKLPVSDYKPWRLLVTDEASLAWRLEDEKVREHFVAG